MPTEMKMTENPMFAWMADKEKTQSKANIEDLIKAREEKEKVRLKQIQWDETTTPSYRNK